MNEHDQAELEGLRRLRARLVDFMPKCYTEARNMEERGVLPQYSDAGKGGRVALEALAEAISMNVEFMETGDGPIWR